jgi:hypothetical protein
MTTLRRQPEDGGAIRLLGLLVLVLGMLVVSVVDVAVDPTTTNVASAVLVDETSVAAHAGGACHDATEPAVAVARQKLSVWRRRVGEWLGNLHRWHPRVGPIRGP